MTKYTTTEYRAFYGLDVHKATISIARCLPGGEPEYLTTITNSPEAIHAYFTEALETYPMILTAYEAGGCGNHVHRTLTKAGVKNLVIAPTLMPTKAGRRVKNDKEDAKSLAEYLANRQLTPIYVPDEDDEAYKAKTRQRTQFRKAATGAKQNLSSWLQLNGIRYTLGKTAWTKTYWTWLGSLKMETADMQEILQDYIDEVERLVEKIAKIDRDLERMQREWARSQVARALAAIRGINLVTAVTITAEIGDFYRFKTAGEFMSYLGLTPREFSSGERVGRNRVRADKIKRGAISKQGNTHVRRLLVEAAWKARHNPAKNAELRKRWKDLDESITDQAWESQKRLNKKYRSMIEKGKPSNVTVTAVARELAGFVWAIGRWAQDLAQEKAQTQTEIA